jgi:hypothetical protein
LEGSISFLKKRNKKLLIIAVRDFFRGAMWLTKKEFLPRRHTGHEGWREEDAIEAGSGSASKHQTGNSQSVEGRRSFYHR